MNRIYHALSLSLLLWFSACTAIISPDETSEQHDWLQKESPHITYFYLPGSLAEKDIDYIMKIQELAFDHILKKLDVHYSGPIRIYIYNEQTASRALVKAGATGIAHPETESVEAIYSSNLKSIGRDGVAAHEMTHVIASVTLMPSHVKILSEGLAVYMDDYWGNNLHDITDLYVWADLYLNNSELPTINNLIHHWDDYESYMTYPVSGSFVKYIYEKYGYDKFRNLYIHADKHNIDELTADIYGIPLDSLESQWHHKIVSYTDHNIRFY